MRSNSEAGGPAVNWERHWIECYRRRARMRRRRAFALERALQERVSCDGCMLHIHMVLSCFGCKMSCFASTRTVREEEASFHAFQTDATPRHVVHLARNQLTVNWILFTMLSTPRINFPSSCRRPPFLYLSSSLHYFGQKLSPSFSSLPYSLHPISDHDHAGAPFPIYPR